MKLLLILAVLVAADAASTAGKCTVGEWGEWQVRQPRDDRTGKSFPVPHGNDDVGGRNREKMMKMKTELAEQSEKCKADGTCPELNQRQSEGAIACVNGEIDGGTGGPDANILCNNINQLSFMNFQDLLTSSSTRGNDIWGWTDPTTGAEIAIMMMMTGTTFVDITDPSSPVAIAFLPSAGASSTWRDGKVVNDWAFIVSEASGHGIQAFDLSRLRTINPGSTVAPDYNIGTVGNCHNIVANPEKGRIYGVGCTTGTHCAERGGLFTVDVSDPANPVELDLLCFDGDGYVHDAQCVNYHGPDAEHVGKDICFCYNEDTFTIIDMNGTLSAAELSRTGYPGSAYTHQGWLTEDHTINLLDDELDEQSGSGELRTYMWDVTDLENPVLQNTYFHGVQSIDHNQYVLGDLTYQADYTTGLRIYRIIQGSNPSLELQGYFDVYPSRDAAIFEGAWSVYPYFPSGNIIISSINYGLYVVQYSGATPKEGLTERMRYRSIVNPGDGVCDFNLQESEWF